MLSFFRRVTNSKIGTWIMAGVLVAILAGFAYSDINNFGSGNIGMGMGGSTLAKVGSQEVTDGDLSKALERRLAEVRQQKPDATYATIAGDFDAILNTLIDEKSLVAFGDKYGFHLSKKLVDAEIAQIPQVRGLNGKFSDQAYQAFLAQQHLTDAEVRETLGANLLQRLILTPLATNSRVPVGLATPYASMMLEARQGEGAAIPLDPFKTGLKPGEADIQKFYADNRAHYVVPEQRVVRYAVIGPQQVANVTASDKEVADYYNANQATYGATNSRTLTQVVVPDQNSANAIAARAKSGATLAAAAAPVGANAAVTSLNDQTRQAYAGAAGEKVAAAVFAAPSGAIVGPVQSDFGWVVVKVESVKAVAGRSLAQAHDEILAKLNADKRKGAIEDIVDKVQNAVDGGSNLTEAAAAAKLPVVATPLVTADGASHADPSFKPTPELAPVIKAGFEIAPNDQPEMVTLPNDAGYALVAPGQVVPSAPAPLAAIRDQVANDWVNDQARRRAGATAAVIAAKAARGVPLAQALQQAGVKLPPPQQFSARRMQIAQANGEVPPPLKLLFTLAQGSARSLADPGGRGFYVVKVDKVVPGNAVTQPGLITQMQHELEQPTSEDYAREFLAAVRAQVKVKRNESAIQAQKTRIVTGS